MGEFRCRRLVAILMGILIASGFLFAVITMMPLSEMVEPPPSPAAELG